jgi:4-hydroxy-3-polyprenylbenzoate decarboxylase
MSKANDLGVMILPPVPAFYHQPKTINDLIDHIVGKILDAFDIDHSLYKRWKRDRWRLRQASENSRIAG